MGSGALSHPDVLALASRFVTVELDVDRRDQLERMLSFRVDDLPNIVFLTANGSFISQLPSNDRMVGTAIHQRMKEALARGEELMARERALLAAVDAKPDSLPALDALGRFLIETRRSADALPYVKRGYDITRATGASGADRRLAELTRINLSLRRFAQADEQTTEFRRLFPRSPDRARVEFYRGLGQYYGRSEFTRKPADLKRAVKTWQELANDHPGTRWARRGKRMIQKAENLLDDARRYPKVLGK